MKRSEFYIGADIAADTFAASVFRAERGCLATKEQIPNSTDGFQELFQWLEGHGITPENGVVCIEATGVYSEAFCYFVVAAGYRIAVESPLKVKRAFHPAGRKNDAVDSQQIAEYAYRFYDELSFWSPSSEIVEELRTLLKLRERISKSLVLHKNARRSLQRKARHAPFAASVTEELIGILQQKLDAIDAEIKRVIKQDPSLHDMVRKLDLIPGVGMLLATYCLALTNGFTHPVDYRSKAAYLGIAPLEHTSGKTVRKPSRSRHFGPRQVRKLLHLAARSVCVHNARFREYYLRKLQEGKPEAVIYNNVSNKLLKIICAIIRSGKGYIPNYRSLNPMLLNAA